MEAVLRHADKWHPKEGNFVSIDAKVKKVAKLAEGLFIRRIFRKMPKRAKF